MCRWCVNKHNGAYDGDDVIVGPMPKDTFSFIALFL